MRLDNHRKRLTTIENSGIVNGMKRYVMYWNDVIELESDDYDEIWSNLDCYKDEYPSSSFTVYDRVEDERIF